MIEGAAVAASLKVDHARNTGTHYPSPFDFKCAIFFSAANTVDAAAVQRGVLRMLDMETDRISRS